MKPATNIVRFAAAALMAGASQLFAAPAATAQTWEAKVATEAETELPATRHGVPHPRLVGYTGTEAAGSIVINTLTRRLYFINGNGTAIEYWVAVAKEGVRLPSGVLPVSRKAVNPYWAPTPNMVRRDPRLVPIKGGDPKNPLGPRALYLGETFYRIHGTDKPWTVGKRASSGCFRMHSDDVTDLYPRVEVGAKVTMLHAKLTPGVTEGLLAAGLRLAPL